MKLGTSLAAFFVLLLQAAVSVQSGDPLSGSWGSDGLPFLELKFDGKNAVTGTAIWRNGDDMVRRTPIRTGTFDPKTGAFRLEGEGERPDGVKGTYVIQGVLKGDTVSGTYKMADRGGDFSFSRLKQTAGKRTPEQMEAAFEKHKGDFDYLLGDWEFTSEDKQYGKLRGYWSAVRLDEGQILDEYRIVSDTGDTYYVTTTLRNYNKGLDRWELIGADAGGGLQDFGTGQRVGDEVHIEQTFGVASGNPSKFRIRYYNIRPDAFSWTGDRSMDGGKTWVKEHLKIEARRIGPARSMGPLAPARNKKK
jgi:hypothetical protein